jgi:hypothetical protein
MAVEIYCDKVEELFNDEMFPRPLDGSVPAKTSIIQKAKQTIQLGEKRVEGFNITSSVCVLGTAKWNQLIHPHFSLASR